MIDTYAAIAARISARPPRLGTVRLVAVDGFAGSGKTTFAGRLGTALGAQVIHTDDLLEGWTDLMTFWPRLESWVLDPLRSGRPGRYRRYDWLHQRFGARWHAVSLAPALVLEGVSAARGAVRDELSYAVWVDAPSEVRLTRGLARDGEHLRTRWLEWQRAELAHAATDRAEDRADLVVLGATDVTYDAATEVVVRRR